jgi:hypothetical protein
VFDRQRLAGILSAAPQGDTRDLAEEVVRLMGAKRAAEEQLRTVTSELALCREQVAEATAVASQVGAVLAEVPKTRRGQFAELEETLTALAGAP